MFPLLLGCSPTEVVIDSPELDDFVSFIDDPRIATSGRGGIQITVATTDCETPGCFSVEGDRKDWTVTGDTLGVQYGVAYLLEEMGFRFLHPWDTHAPDELAPLEGVSGEQAPEIARRGIHLHTLHPTEGYFDTWEDPDSEGGRRIVDWLIKNRGNHLQWVALDDMPGDWEADTTALVDYAHDRGITVGLGVQLYGRSNLQLAFDLIDSESDEQRPQLEEQWARVTGVDFDLYNLSFGEFSDTAPEDFLASVDLAYAVMTEQTDAEMTSVLHVGDDLQVEYKGEELIYYLLAQYANPAIKPWVHTVMFYNLFEDAGGAYHHEEFDQHRELILERLSSGEPVGYFPESAYWVAFDNSVPQAQPLYIRSRWLDLANLPGLDDHVLFSSGWEWGFWQHDVATLRMNWRVPEDYGDTVRWIWEPWGEPGLADAVIAQADLQHDALIDARLAAWVCGRDAAMELGYGLGIVSQPRRPDFDELTEDDRATATALSAHAADIRAIPVPDIDDVWVRELSDGIEIDALRADYMAALIRAAIDHDAAELSAAEVLLESARAVVAARHGDAHDPDIERLITEGDNRTLYNFGYLLRADELCYWERERLQVTALLTGESQSIPACTL
jgi:hypothetical protein